jgi:hypothetical protein
MINKNLEGICGKFRLSQMQKDSAKVTESLLVQGMKLTARHFKDFIKLQRGVPFDDSQILDSIILVCEKILKGELQA